MFTELINKLRWEIINILSIDIDLLFHKIDEVNRQLPASHNPLDEEKKFLLCLYLRGYSQDSIVREYQSLGLTIAKSDINNKMRSVNAGIRELTAEKDKCALINYLLEYGYKITNNRVNTCLSLGGRYFLSNNRNSERTTATQQFLLQNYDSALASFWQLWDKKVSSEETLVYLNNSWLLANQNKLKRRYGIASFKLYKIAVVIPVLYNNGAVAQSLLKGVVTLQLKINLALNRSEEIYYPLAENFSEIASYEFNDREKFGLLVCIARDESDIEYSSNNTAISIKDVDDIMGVIGHYSSEATANALKVYATSNIPLITASAASDNLPGWERANDIFYRVTTKNEIQAGTLARFVSQRKSKAKLAIMYNSHSDYCRSFKKSFIESFSGEIVLEYKNLSGNNYGELRENIFQAQEKQVNIILLIPDGGIHLSSLTVAGNIIRQILARDCWLVGGASLIHQDTLEWVREASSQEIKNTEKIVISCPWFPEREKNSYVARQFCRESQLIWQEPINTWREGTAYDSALMFAKALDKFNSQGGGDRLKFSQILHQFKQDNSCQGVTGNLQFDRRGDRLEPSVELVGIVREKNRVSNQIEYCFQKARYFER